ncbi:MAG: hypothetical protein WA952_03285 [Lewinella sp.]
MPDALSGIANYCFRWCERCPYTGHCTVFEMGARSGAENLRNRDLPRSFPALAGTYKDFLQRLGTQLQRDGIDLDVLESRPPLSMEELITHSRKVVLRYLQDSQWTRGLVRSANFDDPAVQAAHALNWYVITIGPKIQRSLKSRLESGNHPEDYFYADARRTAYLTLLCLSRSIAAITVVLECDIRPRVSLVNLAAEFVQLISSLRTIYPDVSLFSRPVWDDPAELVQQAAFYNGKPPLHPFQEGMWGYGGQRAPGGE